MQKAGDILVGCYKKIAKMIKTVITTMEINDFAESFIRKHGAIPEQIGFNGYPYATCASINDEICHGFPRDEKLKNGDIVTIDMVVNLNGGLADSAWSYAVGEVDERSEEHTSELQSRGHLVCRLLLETQNTMDTDHAGSATLH